MMRFIKYLFKKEPSEKIRTRGLYPRFHSASEVKKLTVKETCGHFDTKSWTFSAVFHNGMRKCRSQVFT